MCAREREEPTEDIATLELMVMVMTFDTTPGNGDDCPVIDKHARGGRSEGADRKREIKR